MKEKQTIGVDVIIDKLTNSIENAISGEVFDTSIIKLTASDIKLIKKSEWAFDWQSELKAETKQVFQTDNG